MYNCHSFKELVNMHLYLEVSFAIARGEKKRLKKVIKCSRTTYSILHLQTSNCTYSNVKNSKTKQTKKK